MKEPLVSICIPSYNSKDYILKTVQSALNQTYQNIEVLVVDDASRDGTPELLKNIMDPRFKLIENKENLGMTGNWNKAVRLCRGDYIKLIPSDDILYPECIERSIQPLIRHHDISLVITGTDLIDPEGRVIGRYAHWPKNGVFPGKRIAKASVMVNNFFGNPVCALFRKEDFEKTGGFDPDIPYILDFDLWLGLSGLGRVCVITETYNAFRVRKDSNTGKMTGKGSLAYTKEHARLIDKHRKQGDYTMNCLERTFSVLWRFTRNYLIAVYIRLKA